jgi:hypothetical protein
MAPLSGLLEKGQARSEEYLRSGLDTWVEEGRIDAARRDELLALLDVPEVEAALFHAGAHFAISIPLRSPFGSIARFFYTLGLRMKSELLALLRRGSAKQARRCHTLVVMLFALIPGFGRLAYFLSPALSHERLLLVVPLDRMARRLPAQVYRRQHLDALFIYWAQPEEPRRGFRHFLYGGWFNDLRGRLRDLRPYMTPITAVLAVDSAALLIGAYLYVDAGQPDDVIWWFRERRAIATLDVAQLLFGGVCGIAAYNAFWRRPNAPVKESAGIFLWGIGGVGLILFGIDDYFSVHEALGRHFARIVEALPIVVNMPDDVLVLGYAVAGMAVLFVFRMELFEDRPSATLLQLAAVAALIMVVSDAFATRRALEALEFPAQTFSNGLLLLAFGVRYLEVTRAARTEAATGAVEAAVR